MPFNDSANTADVQYKLAARKLISALSSRPEELMHYLNRESSIFSKTADPTVLAALRILQLFYDQVKLEVCAAPETKARDSEAFRFLSAIDDETCRSLVTKYAHKVYPREWQELGVTKRTSKVKVPQSVPSFGLQFNDNVESDNASTITEKSSQSGGSNKSKRIIEVSGSSSSSSSTSSPSHKISRSSPSRRVSKSSPSRKVSRSEERKHPSIQQRRPSAQQRQQVDRSCSPIENTHFRLESVESLKSAHARQKASTQRSLNDVADLVSQISMGVQTDAIKVDASTRTQFNNGSSVTSTPQSTEKTTSTSNCTSSAVSSEQHSVGQISMHRAVFLTTRSNYRLVTVGRDGSVQPTFNMPYPLDHSTPVHRSAGRTTVRDLEPQDDEQQETNTRRLERGHFQQVMGSSTESPLIVAEQSIRSSNETRVSEVVEDLPEDDDVDQPTEEDVSTLNQISPLPTG